MSLINKYCALMNEKNNEVKKFNFDSYKIKQLNNKIQKIKLKINSNFANREKNFID